MAGLAAVFYEHSSGLYHEYGGWLNVCPGLAAVGLPFRLWAWPMVSLLRLKRAGTVGLAGEAKGFLGTEEGLKR